MSCEICTANGVDHDNIKRLALSNPYWTGKLLLGFNLMSPSLHQPLAEWFVQRLRRGKKRFLMMIPRGHFKTTEFGQAFLTWCILRNTELRSLYMMATRDMAETNLGVIKDGFTTSEELEHYFPNYVPDVSSIKTVWTKDYIKMPYRKGRYASGTVEARGLDSKVTGGHFNVHVFDDLIDETVVNSVVSQNRAVDFVKRSAPLFVDPSEDIQIIIGTRWPGPYYDWLLEDSGISKAYETVLLGCYVDERYREFMRSIGKKSLLADGDPIFPERFTKETLEEIRMTMGEFDFTHQYLNLKCDEEQRRFREEDFIFYKLKPDRDGVIIGSDKSIAFSDLYRTMTIDPATGEHSKTDQSAITVCGLHRESGRIFVLDVWQDRCLPHALIDKTLEMCEKWEPHLVAPEDVSYQKTFKHYLRRAAVERGISVRIKPVKPGNKSKGARIIDALQPFVRNRQVYVLRQHDKLIKELCDLNVIDGKVIGRSPNLADSLAYHSEFWSGASKTEDDDDDDIKEEKKIDQTAYGLECLT